MQSPQFGALPMRRRRRNAEPVGRAGQIDDLLQVELCVVTETRRLVSRGIAAAENGKFSPMQCGRTPAGPVCDPDPELRCVVVQHGGDQRGTRFLICRNWVAVKGPPSCASCGSALAANSCSARWMACVSSTPKVLGQALCRRAAGAGRAVDGMVAKRNLIALAAGGHDHPRVKLLTQYK